MYTSNLHVLCVARLALLHFNGFQKSRWEFESDKYQLTPPYMESGCAVNGFTVTILFARFGATIKILRAQY